MPDRFEVSAGFANHWKTRKLVRRHGADGLLGVLRWWGYASTDHPDGNLARCTAEDLEAIADWRGEDGALVATAIELRLIDGQPGKYRIHDWPEWNGWNCGATSRKRASIEANNAKRHSKIDRPGDRGGGPVGAPERSRLSDGLSDGRTEGRTEDRQTEARARSAGLIPSGPAARAERKGEADPGPADPEDTTPEPDARRERRRQEVNVVAELAKAAEILGARPLKSMSEIVGDWEAEEQRLAGQRESMKAALAAAEAEEIKLTPESEAN